MPRIELENDFIDPFWIRSIMYFPNDIEKRQQYYITLRMDYETLDSKDGDIYELDAKSIKSLLNAPSYSDFIQQSIQITKEAIVAGDVLASIYLMDKFGLPEPSLNKAYFVSQEFAKKTKYGDGTPMAVSERYVKERWVKYKPVAHFWAAWRINQAYPIATQSEIFSEGFPLFLQLVKELEYFGLNYFPLRAKPQRPILELQQTWTLPESITRKTLISDREPLLLKKYLKKYIAPLSQY